MKLTPTKLLLLALIISIFSACSNEREEDQIILLQKYVASKHNDIPSLESGLFFILNDTAQGDNLLKPQTGDSIFINVTGKLVDNKTQFLSTDYYAPIVQIFNQYPAIKGWDEGLRMMNVGDSAILGLPPDLAYGKKREGLIPPYSAIIFEIRLIKIVRNQ